MASRPPAEGDLVLDRYRLQRLVGKGGAGTVWVAADERLNRLVAVKLLHPQPRVPHAAARLAREARTLAQLRHPGLVTLLDFGLTADNAPAMVMEYLEGVSLKALAESHPFSAAEVAAVLDQALGGIDACHAQGVIHRDLKPANVLVARASNTLLVKIIDFGIVALAADPGATALTVSGEVFGSLRFMPPEQWRQAEVGPHTDLYALGCVAYYLLLGEPFIRELSPVKVFTAHLEQPRPRPTHDRAGRPVPAAFLDVLVRACAPDWRDRYADAPSMRAALQPFVGEVPTPPLPEVGFGRSLDRPISVRELLNAHTEVADLGESGRTAVMDSVNGLSAGELDPSATLVSAPPEGTDGAPAEDLQTRLMAAVSGQPASVRSGGVGAVASTGPVPPARGSGERSPLPAAARGTPSTPAGVERVAPPKGGTGATPKAEAGPPTSRETRGPEGADLSPAPPARHLPWWVWLVLAGLFGGVVGFVATRF